MHNISEPAVCMSLDDLKQNMKYKNMRKTWVPASSRQGPAHIRQNDVKKNVSDKSRKSTYTQVVKFPS